MPHPTPTVLSRRVWLLVLSSVLGLLTCTASAQSLTWVRHAIPTPRSTPIAAELSRSRMLLFGGSNLLSSTYGDTWEWDGRKWIERTPANSPSPRSGFALAADSDRDVVVLFGGGRLDDATWEWDGLDWTRRSPVVSPPGRVAHAMAYDPVRQRVVMFGGGVGTGELDDTWEWDGNNWILRTPAQAPSRRVFHAMAFDPTRGQVLLFGGRSSSVYTNDTWAWDGTNWTLLVPTNRPPALLLQGMTTDWSRGVVVFRSIDNSTWEWNGTDWTSHGTAAIPQAGKLAFDSANNRVALFGGRAAETWHWDGSGWTLAAANPFERIAMAYDRRRDRMVLFGKGPGLLGLDTWEWIDNQWQLTRPRTVPQISQADAGMVYDAGAGRVVLFSGGWARPSTELWEWDGVDWTQRVPANRPPTRAGYGLAYDTARNRIVMFSGYVGSANAHVNDTWEWSGSDWVLRSPAQSPPGRDRHMMAYDEARQRTVLFGGRTSSGPYLDDTWEWDGVNWMQRHPAHRPPGNFHGAMDYDRRRQKVVLVGGLGASTPIPPSAQAWEWDGNDWSRLPDVGIDEPHEIEYHAKLQRLMLFAGDLYREETWFLGSSSPQTASYGAGCAGSAGVPELSAFGKPHVGELSFALDVTSARPSSAAVLLVAATPANLSLGGCALLVPAGAVPVVQTTTNSGFASVRLPIPEVHALVGVSLFAQAAIVDPAGWFSAAALTNGIQIDLGE